MADDTINILLGFGEKGAAATKAQLQAMEQILVRLAETGRRTDQLRYPLEQVAERYARLTTAKVAFTYCDGSVEYTTSARVVRDDHRGPLILCRCGSAVRALYRHPLGRGLCCADCVRRVRQTEVKLKKN